jgi:nicotinamidase-related amidase
MTSTHDYLSDAWIRGWEERRERRERYPFAPAKSALLLIDLQRHFIDPGGKAFIEPSKRIMPKLLNLAAAYKKRGLPIVLTRHIDDPSKHPLIISWWEGAIAAADPMSRLVPELEPFVECSILVEKHWYDAFRHTGLAQILEGRGVSQVVVGGVMTHVCCETTTRSAFAHNLTPFFLLDGTAADRAENHEATLVNLQHAFAVLTTCGEILAGVRSRH